MVASMDKIVAQLKELMSDEYNVVAVTAEELAVLTACEMV